MIIKTGNGVQEEQPSKVRKGGNTMPAFLANATKAEFAANWKLFFLERVEVKAATQVTFAASPCLSLIQPVQANSNELSHAQDRETK